MIRLEELGKRYGATAAVDGVSTEFAPRAITAVVGSSGSGKSTLLRLVNRLVEPSAGRVLIDAGSKILSSDLGGLSDHGQLVDHPQARLYKLAEEHGFVDVSACERAPQVGEVVRVRPNHACVVSNLVDRLWCTRDGEPCGTLEVDARGRVA